MVGWWQWVVIVGAAAVLTAAFDWWARRRHLARMRPARVPVERRGNRWDQACRYGRRGAP